MKIASPSPGCGMALMFMPVVLLPLIRCQFSLHQTHTCYDSSYGKQCALCFPAGPGTTRSAADMEGISLPLPCKTGGPGESSRVIGAAATVMWADPMGSAEVRSSTWDCVDYAQFLPQPLRQAIMKTVSLP